MMPTNTTKFKVSLFLFLPYQKKGGKVVLVVEIGALNCDSYVEVLWIVAIFEGALAACGEGLQ